MNFLLLGYAAISFVLLGGLATPVAFAGENQFSLLTNTLAFQRMKESGEWDITVLPEAIGYSCPTCAGSVVARLEIVSPYVVGGFEGLNQRYLAERRQFCADLATAREGRCVSNRKAAWRFGFRGFRSVHETLTESVSEVVLFHRGYNGVPEKLRTTIRMEKGENSPASYDSLFIAHMARLSPLY